MLQTIAKLPFLKRPISSIGIRLLKLLNKNRGYFKIQNIKMFLDFLDPIDREIILNQEYDKKEISILKKLIQLYYINNFIDIGANCGIYSFMLSSNFKDLNTLAFEPNKEAFLKFNKTLDANLNLSKRIQIFNFGLFDKKAKLQMRSLVKHRYIQTGGSTVHDFKNYNNTTIYEADFELGDNVIDVINSNIAIKIDVEGHEYKVLLGLKKLLNNNNCILQIEIWDNNYKDVNSHLTENNFVKIAEVKSKYNYFYSNIKKPTKLLFQD